MPTFLQQDCGGVARDVVLKIGAPRQPVGQVRDALLPTVKVALGPAVKPEKNHEYERSEALKPRKKEVLALLAAS